MKCMFFAALVIGLLDISPNPNLIKHALNARAVDPNRYDVACFFEEGTPGTLHLYSFGQLWGNNQNDPSIVFNAIPAKRGQTFKISARYYVEPDSEANLLINIQQYEGSLVKNQERPLSRTGKWLQEELLYTSATDSPIRVGFSFWPSKVPGTPWRGHARVKSISLTLVP